MVVRIAVALVAFHSKGSITLLRVRSSQMRIGWQRPMGLRLVAPTSRTIQPLPCSWAMLTRSVSNHC